MNPLPETLHSEPETFIPKRDIPRWLVVAILAVLATGAVLILGRGWFDESSAYDAMSGCKAKVSPYLREKGDDGKIIWTKPNGLDDNFASIRIDAERDNVAAVVSICESDTAQGLRLFRKALTSGNKSAKLVALYCANYLARAQVTPLLKREKGVLEASDFDLMLKQFDEPVINKDSDVRKAALRAISDLVIITNPAALATADDSKAENRFTAISESMEAAAKAAFGDEPDEPPESETKDKTRDLKIVTRKDVLDGKPVLLIRWSTPALAKAWFKEHEKDNGIWNKELQRFVVP